MRCDSPFNSKARRGWTRLRQFRRQVFNSSLKPATSKPPSLSLGAALTSGELLRSATPGEHLGAGCRGRPPGPGPGRAVDRTPSRWHHRPRRLYLRSARLSPAVRTPPERVRAWVTARRTETTQGGSVRRSRSAHQEEGDLTFNVVWADSRPPACGPTPHHNVATGRQSPPHPRLGWAVCRPLYPINPARGLCDGQ